MNLLDVLLYQPFLNLLTFFIATTPGHYAATGIVLVTLAVRFALLIPSRRAAQAQRRIAQLQPLLNELKSEYADDKQGLAAAQMELYKKNGINPFGSFVPILIQLPILIGLYHSILNGLMANSAGLYGWLPRPPYINAHFFWTDLLKPDPLFLLPVAAAALQFLQVKMTLPVRPEPKPGEEPDPAAAAQKTSLFLLPLVTLFISYKLPAGIALYWVVGTVFTVLQQRSVNKEKFKIAGVAEALREADTEHPEHGLRSLESTAEIADAAGLPVKAAGPAREVRVGTKGGVKLTVTRRGSTKK